MAINITREYPRAQIAKSQDGLSDVVVSIYCVVKAEDSVTGKSCTIGRDISLDPPIPSQFVSFDQITRELCDSWVTGRDQYSELESRAVSEASKQDEVTVVPMPFSTETQQA